MENKCSILVVDDMVGPREALRMILKNKHEVVTAEDGDNALECLSKKDFYVAIIDIKMAGMDGLQLLKKIKEKKPDTEVILMTAYASVDTGLFYIILDRKSKRLNYSHGRIAYAVFCL